MRKGCLRAVHTLHALLEGLREAHAKVFVRFSLKDLRALPGGRVTGAEVIAELITELDASVEAAAGFEGEMQRLSGYARYTCSLACATLSGALGQTFHHVQPGAACCRPYITAHACITSLGACSTRSH